MTANLKCFSRLVDYPPRRFSGKWGNGWLQKQKGGGATKKKAIFEAHYDAPPLVDALEIIMGFARGLCATKAEVGRQVPAVTLPLYVCTYSRLPCRCRCPPPVNWNLCCRSTASFDVCYTGDCGWARAVWVVPGALCE